MNETYDEILQRMQDKFEELAGYEADEAGDIGIRLRLLAGEIYSLGYNIDAIKKQMFPGTATGEYLDLHAQQRGLVRKEGKKAAGTIVFRLDMPLEYAVTIPAGTICTVSDGSLNYVTTAAQTINRGSTYAWVPCKAEYSGEQYNIGSGLVNTVVTYFSVGISVNNSTSFSGGTDDESDESLRKRLFENYSNTPDGANGAYYARIAERVEGVQSALAKYDVQDPGKVTVYLGGHGDMISDDVLNEAISVLEEYTPLGIVLDVNKAYSRAVEVRVGISTENGYTFAAVSAAVEAKIREFLLSKAVGEDVYLANLGRALLEVDGVKNYVFDNMTDIYIDDTRFAVPGYLYVTELT